MQNEKLCLIFGAGDLYDSPIPNIESRFIIAADGGLEHTKRLGLVPDVILGDFDSADKPKGRDDCIVYPTEKDYSDMRLAVEHAYALGFRKMSIYGGLGGKRFEHSIANLQMISEYSRRGCSVVLHGDGECIYAFSSDGDKKTISFDRTAVGYVSLFASGGVVSGLTIDGLKYELCDYTLSPFFALGLSNEFCGVPSSVSFRSGTLIVVCNENISPCENGRNI